VNGYLHPDLSGARVNGFRRPVEEALESRLAAFPDAKIQTRSQFKTSFERPINQLLGLLYVLLGLSVIISLSGS